MPNLCEKLDSRKSPKYECTASLKEDLYKEKGLERPPETQAGAAWYVDGAETLKEVLVQLHPQVPPSHDVEKVRSAQQIFNAKFDGGAARRVWNHISPSLGAM
ncbi:hypothetical protein CYMTET_50823 [Cymbomonas tetramitiformis]|uniref:Uncharacterized protein n=1 Tax=Cymbomonas tetramitiformis TaxID=36881 RepID=A0AAE0BP19_9CHLO|nr:hypothetical protein CYMTET_50823 [Cymbomonas tetramitiformis]